MLKSIHVTEDVRRVIEGKEKLLSASLRLTKYARVNETGKGPIDWVCEGVMKLPATDFTDLPGAESIIMRLRSNLIINQGGGVLENAGLCLHRFSGCPYIPGSAVKGTARHAAWHEWSESQDIELAKNIALTFGYPTNEDELDKFLKSKFPDLFGEKGKLATFAGTVSFLPAFPVEKPELVVDIVNCHHTKYYQGNQLPYDNENPIPIFFPAVEAGAQFEFVICPALRNWQHLAQVFGLKAFDPPINFALKYLRIGLEEQGIGAKTAAGYGWFKRDKEMEDVVAEQRKKEQVDVMAKKEEEDRMASLSPEERQALEYWKTITGDHDSYIINKFKEIKTLPEDERNNLLILCRNEARRIWLGQCKQFRAAEKEISVLEKQVAGLTGKKAAKQLKKLNKKKENASKNLDKFRSRVEPVLEEAAALGIALPEVGS